MARRTKAWMFLILTLASCLLCAQEYSFSYFGTADGLNNLAIRSIYQDHAGFIWVSTENGIFRYDGERFEAFGPAQGIPSTAGAAFGDAPDGSLLVGGDFGLYRLSGNRFEKLSVAFKQVTWRQSIQSDGKGHTFLGADTGLVELYSQPGQNGFRERQFPRPQGTSGPAAYGVLLDGNIVWYGCGGEICRMDSHGTTVLGLESGLPCTRWQAIRSDRDGNLWARGQNAGVFVRKTGQSRFKKPDSPVLANALGGVPAVDDDGRILLPSADGLFIQDGKSWQKVDRAAGLRGTVYAAFEDRQHALWIGSAGRGLALWRGYREWESYSAASGLGSDLVYEILPLQDGTLWLATEGGLYSGKQSNLSFRWKRFTGLGSFPVHSLQMAPGGDLWIGTEIHGAARIHLPAGNVEWFGAKQGLAGNAAYTLRFDREHRLWAATEAGLFVARPPYRSFSRIEEIPHSRIWGVVEASDGAIWAGGSGGLYRYAGGRWRNWTRADGLSNQEVLSLGAGRNGAIWVGYRFGGGIDRIYPTQKGPEPGGVTIEKGVQRPGSDGLVYFLDFDHQGRLWVGTEQGVDMWDSSRWSHFDMRDGLAWNDCNLNAFAEDASGAIWIGTSGGLSRFRPRQYSSPDLPLEVVFTRLMMGKMDVSGQRNPSFGSPANSLLARFSAPNASRENEVMFRYRLEGANSGWTETARRELQFARLAPGNYRLDVQALDGVGTWSGRTAEFPFTIRPPWYWTWWFVAFCALIPPAAVLVALRLRMVTVRNRERELLRMVEEKTADLQLANEELSRLSFTDPLTGLQNRRVFDQALEREFARTSRTGSPLSLVIMDVDLFKALNDSDGHQRGDECLMLFGAELKRIAKRRIDVAARIGGEEFALILPETDAPSALQVAESVRLAIAALKILHPASHVAAFLTISAGVATAFLDEWNAPEKLVAAADQALYHAKRTGRNRVVAAQWRAVEQATPGLVNSSLA
jgi:diguanylate cyclase (GGDEF)-like protein